MQEGLFEFLKHIGSFPKLFRFHILQNVSSFIPLTCALKFPAIKIYQMFWNKTRWLCLWHLNVTKNYKKLGYKNRPTAT